MEFNRNQFFMAGIFLVLLGVQFRLIDSITLNEKTTKFLAARAGQTTGAAALSFIPGTGGAHKVIQPPTWIGWALISAGAVCVLHSLAMKKPGAG